MIEFVEQFSSSSGKRVFLNSQIKTPKKADRRKLNRIEFRKGLHSDIRSIVPSAPSHTLAKAQHSDEFQELAIEVILSLSRYMDLRALNLCLQLLYNLE